MTNPNAQIRRLNETEILLKSSFRTMAIFEFFADIQRPARINEIASALKIPQSSTSTIVGSLVDTGYLTKNATKRTFSPSMRINYLNAWRGDLHPVAASFNRNLKSLHEDTGETAVLAMRNGIYSQYILVQHSHEILRKHVETGSVRPLVCSATGWSLLAHEDDKEIQKLIHRTRLSTENPRWIKTTHTAMQHIGHVRENGFAWSDGEAANGASGLAVAILDRKSCPRLSIGVAGPSPRMNEKKQEILESIKALIATLPDHFTDDVLSPVAE